MKNLVFAIQVFGLLTVVPLYAISELKQAPAKSTKVSLPSDVIEMQTTPNSKATDDTSFSLQNQYWLLKAALI